MAEAGAAYVPIKPDASTFQSQLGAKVNSALHNVGSKLKTAGRRMTLGLTLPILAGMKAAIGAADEARKITAQTDAVIKSTGGVARVTAEDVMKLGSHIQGYSGISDETIRSGQNLLLTFKNIRNEAGKGNDIFTQTTKIATDVSVAMGQDMKSSAIQLGKALNDPTKGMSALSRVGITFSKGQENQIKKLQESGDLMGAQKIILKELSTQFGGSAAAQATAADKLKAAFGDLLESIGNILIPIVDRVSNFLTKLFKSVEGLSPRFRKLIVVGAGLAAALGPLLWIVGGLMTAIASGALPIAALVAGIGAFIFIVIKAYRESETFRRFVSDAFQTIRRIATEVWPHVAEVIQAAMEAVERVIKTVVAIVKAVWRNYGDIILETTKRVFQAIAQRIKGALQIIKGIFQAITAILTGDWDKLGEALKNIAKGAWNMVVGTFKLAYEVLLGVGKAILRGLWDGAKAILNGLSDWFRSLPGRIVSWVGDMGQALYQKGRDLIMGFIRGIRDAALAIPGEVAKALPGGGSISNKDARGVGKAIGLAEGGIVTRPTLAMIGEGGESEAVIPLSKLPQMAGAGGGALRLVSGTLSIDESGRAYIKGLAAVEAHEQDHEHDRWRADLKGM